MAEEAQVITREQVAEIVARVRAMVRACPVGRVTTYGAIGAALGYPKGTGARMVGWIMNESGHDDGTPAQRVINSKGELTGSWAFGRRGSMRELLESEGVQFTPKGSVDLKRYLWDPARDLSDDERATILAGATVDSDSVSDRLLHLLRDDPASPFRVQRTP